MNTKPSQKNKGFTIIESLVAISILVIAITGPLSIVAQSLRSSYFARDQMTAFYLAQEAIEYIRNVRDENSLRYPTNPDMWLSGIETTTDVASNSSISCLNDSNSEINKCSLVRTTTGYGFLQCDASGCAKLNYDPATGLFGGSTYTGTISAFSRTISLNRMARAGGDEDDTEILVTVEIKWNSGGNQNVFKIRDYLTNWKAEDTI